MRYSTIQLHNPDRFSLLDGEIEIARIEPLNEAGEKLLPVIAAAPDLLSAAEDALESLSRLPDADNAWRITCITQLKSAIAKARQP